MNHLNKKLEWQNMEHYKNLFQIVKLFNQDLINQSQQRITRPEILLQTNAERKNKQALAFVDIANDIDNINVTTKRHQKQVVRKVSKNRGITKTCHNFNL